MKMKTTLLPLIAILIWVVSPGVNPADSINGSDGDDRLAGTAGNDTIRAGAGDDFIEGGPLKRMKSLVAQPLPS